jgi:ABC-2 type transport system permease protein
MPAFDTPGPIAATARGTATSSFKAQQTDAAIAWCVGIALVGYLWPRATFSQRA